MDDCQNNPFCSSLNQKDRGELCGICTKRSYVKGQPILWEDTITRFNLLISGFYASANVLSQSTITNDEQALFGICAPGLTYPNIALFSDSIPENLSNNWGYCRTDCEVARFRNADIRMLFHKGPSFAEALFTNAGMYETEISKFAAVFRSGNIHLQIQFILKYLSEKDLSLTQQQIADLFGRNRSSVSTAISKLARAYPEFFEKYKSALGK